MSESSPGLLHLQRKKYEVFLWSISFEWLLQSHGKIIENLSTTLIQNKKTQFITELEKDVSGQVKEAFSKQEWY